MTLPVVANCEKVCSDALRAHADIIALGARVVGKTPDDKTTPWIRVTELDSPQVGQPDKLVEFMMQFDCVAGATGGQPEATNIGRAVRAVLGTLPLTNTGVTSVRVLGGPRQLDTDLEPARDVKIITAIVWMR